MQTLGLLQKGGCVASPHPVSHFVSMKLQAVFKFGEEEECRVEKLLESAFLFSGVGG